MKKFLNKVISFLKEVKTEIKKVSWPDRKTTLKYTLIVIGVSVGVAIYLWGLDSLFIFLLRKFILK